MKAREFIEKWLDKIPPSILESGNGSIVEFEQDVWSLSGEEKPQMPDVAFLNKWTGRICTTDYDKELIADIIKLTKWAKEEGIREFTEKINKINYKDPI